MRMQRMCSAGQHMQVCSSRQEQRPHNLCLKLDAVGQGSKALACMMQQAHAHLWGPCLALRVLG